MTTNSFQSAPEPNAPVVSRVSPMRAVTLWREELAAAREKVAAHDEVWDGWRLDFDRALRRCGQTRYNDRVVSLSVHFLNRASEDDVRSTIRHELAHVVAGHAAGHGQAWKMYARILGHSAERLNRAELAPGPVPLYRAHTNGLCDCTATAHRAGKHVQNGAFVCRKHKNRLVWVKTR